MLRNAGIRRGKLYGQWLVGCAVMVFDFDNFDPKQLCTIVNTYGVTSFCAPPHGVSVSGPKGHPRHAEPAPRVHRR